jgi:hypothetical protein
MSLAGCSGDRGSRLPTAKLSSGPEDPHSFPSDPLQVCSPDADLHTTADEEKEVNAEDIDSRLYEVDKSYFDAKTTGLVIALLFRHKLTLLQSRFATDVLVERLGCRPEEILYTFYKDWSSSLLLSHLKNSLVSAEEKQTMRTILENRGETIPEAEAEEEKEARERREYELTDLKFKNKDTHTLVPMLFSNKELTTLERRIITDILVERLNCLPEEILYTFYDSLGSFALTFNLKIRCMSPEEEQVVRSILERKGVTIPEPRT